jgi:hypothetical protein
VENKGDNTGDDEVEMWHHCTLVGESAVGQARRTSMERGERVCDRGASTAAAGVPAPARSRAVSTSK